VTLLMALFLAAAAPDTDDAADWRAQLPGSLSLEDPQDPDARRARQARESSEPKYGLGVELQGRWSLPLGSASRDVAAVSNPGGGIALVYSSHLDWSDLFSSGWGTSLTVEVTVVRAGTTDGGYGRARNNFSFGTYVSLMQDHLSGDRVSDDSGTSLTADDMTMESYIVGGTVYQNMGNSVYTEGRLGIGAVHYSQVNGTFRYPFPINQTFEGTLFEDTWTLTLEVRGAIGYRLGPLGLSLGTGFRMMMPPKSGDAIDLNSGVLLAWDIDLGVELGF
jgi:hypothetical protein